MVRKHQIFLFPFYTDLKQRILGIKFFGKYSTKTINQMLNL